MGVAARQAGRYDDAERHLRRALEIRRKSLEPTSYYIAITLAAQGDLERARRRPAEAERLYREAVTQWESSGRDAQGSISTITQGYVELLRGQGRTQEAAAIVAKGK